MVQLWKKKTFNGDGWEVTKPLENHWWQWCPQKIILPSHRWKKWPSYRSMRNCGQGSSVLWPVCGTRIGPLAPVRRCEILEFKTGEEGRGRWEWVGPTILPTALWADCAVLIINYDSVFDTELFVMTLYQILSHIKLLWIEYRVIQDDSVLNTETLWLIK